MSLLSKYAMLFVGKKGPLENGFKVITMEFYSYLVLLSYYNQVKTIQRLVEQTAGGLITVF
jgi:hypothetical protein